MTPTRFLFLTGALLVLVLIGLAVGPQSIGDPDLTRSRDPEVAALATARAILFD